MKTNNTKMKKRLFGVFRIFVYINTNKQTKETKIRWFSITRIVVILWNFVTWLYHFFWIGMTSTSSITQHVIGMIIEYLISGIYENSVVRIDKLLNHKTQNTKYKNLKRFVFKYLSFTLIFNLTYNLAYICRIYIFYIMGWGIDLEKTILAITNNTLFGIFGGAVVVALIVLKARKNNLKIKILKK